MYGGNSKSLKQLVDDVTSTVFGQDDAVRTICGFLSLGSERSRTIHEDGGDPHLLPTMGAALIVGPTASGKTHMVKTIARCAGFGYMSIDAGEMTAAGYRGAGFGSCWARAAAALGRDQDTDMLIFIDEVDKLLVQKNEGNAKFDLLKPLEGGMLEGGSERDEGRYVLDCDRCHFILAGAFTGVERIVSDRLGQSHRTIGFSVDGADSKDVGDFEDSHLRSKLSLDDLERWGAPRELIGRISTVCFMPALGEEPLRELIRHVKTEEYGRLLPQGMALRIDEQAEDALVRRALESHYGARSIAMQLNHVFTSKLAHEVADDNSICSVTITAVEGDLSCNLEHGQRRVVEVESEAPKDRPAEPHASFSLLDQVQRALEGRRGEDFYFDGRIFSETNEVAYATSLLIKSARGEGKKSGIVRMTYMPAELLLLAACVCFLRDWMSEKDRNVSGLFSLLRMACWDGGWQTPLGQLFGEIATGERIEIRRNNKGKGARPEEKLRVKSLLKRKADGLRPAVAGGLSAGQDASLDYFSEFVSFSRGLREEALTSLTYRLIFCDNSGNACQGENGAGYCPGEVPA